MKTARTAAALAALAAPLPLCAPANGAAPEVLVSSHHEADIIGVTAGGATLTIDVVSAMGVGMAEVKLLGGSWPPAVALRFHTLPELEGLRVSARGRMLRCDLLRLEGFPPRHGCLLDGQAAGAVRRAEGLHEVALPADLLPPPGETLRIEWIDYWR